MLGICSTIELFLQVPKLLILIKSSLFGFSFIAYTFGIMAMEFPLPNQTPGRFSLVFKEFAPFWGFVCVCVCMCIMYTLIFLCAVVKKDRYNWLNYTERSFILAVWAAQSWYVTCKIMYWMVRKGGAMRRWSKGEGCGSWTWFRSTFPTQLHMTWPDPASKNKPSLRTYGSTHDSGAFWLHIS